MVFKIIITAVSSFSLGLVIGILIVYFLIGRKFFRFMKIERMNMISEMNSNSNEVLSEVDRRAKESELKHKLLKEQGGNLDGKEE